MEKLSKKVDSWIERIDMKIGNLIFLIIGVLLFAYSIIDLESTISIGIVEYEAIPGSFAAAYTLFALGLIRYYLNYRYRANTGRNNNGITKDYRNKITSGLLFIIGFSCWPIDSIADAVDLIGAHQILPLFIA